MNRLAARRARHAAGMQQRFNLSSLFSALQSFNYGGGKYLLQGAQTWTTGEVEGVEATLPGYLAALRTCPPAFAAQMIRADLLSQLELVWKGTRFHSKPGSFFGTAELALLEEPWPKADTGDLLGRMEWHAGLAGNAFVWHDLGRSRLRILRPDWTSFVFGSDSDPSSPIGELDLDLLGFMYQPGGPHAGKRAVFLRPEDVAHWAPIPDPEAEFRGMSWITPAVRELQADRQARDHTLKFWEHGGTPNLVFTLDKSLTPTQVQEFAALIDSRHSGVENAYRNLFLGGGADVEVVGKDLQQLDFTNVQAMTENRIAVLSGIPAQILGIKEGNSGATLNAGNFAEARRKLSDIFFYGHARGACRALAQLFAKERSRELTWSNEIPFLREDADTAAKITGEKAKTIRTLTDGGFEPASVVEAVETDDLTKLQHTGLLSVQMQTPGTDSGSTSGGSTP